jgi:hypothetical protein
MRQVNVGGAALAYVRHGSGEPILLIHGVLVGDLLRPLAAIRRYAGPGLHGLRAGPTVVVRWDQQSGTPHARRPRVGQLDRPTLAGPLGASHRSSSAHHAADVASRRTSGASGG